MTKEFSTLAHLDPKDKSRALDLHRSQGGDEQIIQFWQDHTSQALQEARPVIAALSEDQLAQWSITVETDPRVRQIINAINHLAGPVFESIATTAVNVRKYSPFYFWQLNGEFLQIVRTLHNVPGLDIEMHHPSPEFNGVRIHQDRQPMYIPDGLVLKFHNGQIVLTGIFECQLHSRVKSIWPYNHFAQVIENHAFVLAKMKELLHQDLNKNHNGHDLPLTIDPDDFHYALLVRQDIDEKDVRKQREAHWQVIRSPFSWYDVTSQAARILRSM